jgi:hypothetical protein
MSELYAIVDCARDRRIFDLVHDALFPMCLFTTAVLSPIGRNAPYLLPVEHADRLMNAWRTVGAGQNWGLFVRSSLQQARLRQRLRTFNLCRLPNGKTVLFRWWDPRVFRVYLPSCPSEDLSLWFDGVDDFICERPGGGYERFHLGGAVVANRERAGASDPVLARSSFNQPF